MRITRTPSANSDYSFHYTEIEGKNLAAPRKLPQIDDLRNLIEIHSSVAKVSEAKGWPVSSIYAALRRDENRLQSNIRPGIDFMPWSVSREHMNSSTGRRLLLGNRANESIIALPTIIQADYSAWKSRLECKDYVVCYHALAEASKESEKGGFFYRPRKHGEVPGLMQLPDKDEQPPSRERIAEWAADLS